MNISELIRNQNKSKAFSTEAEGEGEGDSVGEKKETEKKWQFEICWSAEDQGERDWNNM